MCQYGDFCGRGRYPSLKKGRLGGIFHTSPFGERLALSEAEWGEEEGFSPVIPAALPFVRGDYPPEAEERDLAPSL
jgi:hypothetical protein